MAKPGTRQLARDELGDEGTTTSTKWIQEDVENLGLPSRTCFDLLVKTAAVLSDVTGCAHWFVCRYFSQAAI